MRATLLASFVFTQPMIAYAAPESSICDQAAVLAAESHGVPPQVMLAITRVETGRKADGLLLPWPWAVHQAGEGHWFDTQEEAADFVQSAIDQGATNIDVGCFQLNLRWHRENFSSLMDMMDPIRNADYAARFLVDNHQRQGNWVDAVAAYHSATATHAKRYVESVERVLTDLSNPMPGAAPAAPIAATPASQRINRFALLRPGDSSGMGSLVPQAPGSAPLIGMGP